MKNSQLSTHNSQLKEANETLYWLELLHQSEYIADQSFESIGADSEELLKLLVSIVKSSRESIMPDNSQFSTFNSQLKEGQNIEWKQSWRDEYLKWICGFANTQRVLMDTEKTAVKVSVKILQLLEENPSMTLAKLASIIQKSKRAVELASSRLVKDGRLRYVGPQKGVYLTQPSESATLTGEVARLRLVCRETMSRRELQEALLLKGDDNFRRLYLSACARSRTCRKDSSGQTQQQVAEISPHCQGIGIYTSFSALKGLNIKAWGNAPGIWQNIFEP